MMHRTVALSALLLPLSIACASGEREDSNFSATAITTASSVATSDAATDGSTDDSSATASGTDGSSAGSTDSESGEAETDTDDASTDTAVDTTDTEDPSETTDTTDTDTSETTGVELDGVVFVHVGIGLDSNLGTAAEPKRTIQAGIAAAAELIDGVVHVAEGTYEVDYQNNKFVTLTDGVSIFGGYSADDWELRDPIAHPSVIVDKSASGGTDSEPNRAVDGGVGVGSDTVVDGFTIQGGTGSHAAAVVLLDSSPTLTNNRILGGAASGLRSYGVWCESSAATLMYNAIEAGDAAGLTGGYGVSAGVDCDAVLDGNFIYGGGGSSSTYGVWIGESAPRVYNNFVHSGEGMNSPIGVWINQASPEVANNTIICGKPGFGRGVYTSDTTAATVENNIIVGFQYCLYETDTFSEIVSVKNNDLYCDYVARTGWNGASHLELAPMEDSFNTGGATAAGNVKVEPTFVEPNDHDYHLKGEAETLCDLSQGGLDLSDLYTLDVDAAERSAPWSIGAHELDDACM